MSGKNFGVFISYRRSDTAGHAGRLRETLNRCGVTVVLIGKRWPERETSMPPFGDPTDIITQEIQIALDPKVTFRSC